MAKRSQTYIKMPWAGGINDSVDPGVLPDSDLVTADNILFSSAGARIKRPGLDYLDDIELPAISSAAGTATDATLVVATGVFTKVAHGLSVGNQITFSSAGTATGLATDKTLYYINTVPSADTFTIASTLGGATLIFGGTNATTTYGYVVITFASAINNGTNDKLVVDEAITVTSSTTAYSMTAANIVSIPSSTTIKYAAPVTTGTATITAIVRSSAIIKQHDFWYFDSSNNTRNRYILAITTQAKIFKFDINGRRTELTRTTQAVTLNNGTPGNVSGYTHGLNTGQIISFSSITTSTGLSINTPYYVDYKSAADFYLAATPGGARLSFTGGTATLAASWGLTLPINQACLTSFNEKCIISSDGIKNAPVIFDPLVSLTAYTHLKVAAPNFSKSMSYEGRLVTDDKNNPDRVHYSSPGNHTEWQGYGNSGVVDIGLGDGDPEGIVSIAPPFKGALFVSKSKTLYRFSQPGIETSPIEKVSNGISAISHGAAVNIDMDDCLFISDRGFHSMGTTNAYGDFTGSFLSEKIQNAFNSFTDSRKKYTQGIYLSKYSSVFFTVSQNAGSTQDMVWAYNVKFKEWYRWPNVNLASVSKYTDSSGTDNLMFGDYESRLVKVNPLVYTDYGTDTIPYLVKTGKIYVDGNPNSIKAFKRLGLLFKPQGTFSFTVTVKIDNQPSQSLVFTKSTSGDLLGSTFILGTSTLAYSSDMNPFMRPIDGYGRGIQITIDNNALDQQVSVYGIMIEYVPAGSAQETFVSGTTTE